MGDQSEAEIQRRVTFTSFVLGVMLGLGFVMIAVSIYTRSPFMLIPVLPLLLGAVPVSRAIRRSRNARRALEKPLAVPTILKE